VRERASKGDFKDRYKFCAKTAVDTVSWQWVNIRDSVMLTSSLPLK